MAGEAISLASWAQPAGRMAALAGVLVLALLAACDPSEPEGSAGSTGLEVRSRAAPAPDPEGRRVEVADFEEAITLLREIGYWGDEEMAESLVPRVILMRIGDKWTAHAEALPVETSKEIFYRLMEPLVLKANELIAADRATLQRLAARRGEGTVLNDQDLAWLLDLATVYRVVDPEASSEALNDAEIAELLLRVDAVPPSLALGQAAYESAYGTSRFARLGNALFGQWTWSGEGLKPERQRGELGDHRIAVFQTPLDSMLAYARNLNSHPAYGEFRARRAALRRQGAPLDGLVLAESLTGYSERGAAYVETLQQIIRTNLLQAADSARLQEATPIYLYPEGGAAAQG